MEQKQIKEKKNLSQDKRNTLSQTQTGGRWWRHKKPAISKNTALHTSHHSWQSFQRGRLLQQARGTSATITIAPVILLSSPFVHDAIVQASVSQVSKALRAAPANLGSLHMGWWEGCIYEPRHTQLHLLLWERATCLPQRWAVSRTQVLLTKKRSVGGNSCAAVGDKGILRCSTYLRSFTLYLKFQTLWVSIHCWKFPQLFSCVLFFIAEILNNTGSLFLFLHSWNSKQRG